MKRTVEATHEDVLPKLPEVEKENRLDAFVFQCPGVNITGAGEPSSALIDEFVQMLRGIALESRHRQTAFLKSLLRLESDYLMRKGLTQEVGGRSCGRFCGLHGDGTCRRVVLQQAL
eukprot:1294307-Amphidinium_carterae.1